MHRKSSTEWLPVVTNHITDEARCFSLVNFTERESSAKTNRRAPTSRKGYTGGNPKTEMYIETKNHLHWLLKYIWEHAAPVSWVEYVRRVTKQLICTMIDRTWRYVRWTSLRRVKPIDNFTARDIYMYAGEWLLSHITWFCSITCSSW